MGKLADSKGRVGQAQNRQVRKELEASDSLAQVLLQKRLHFKRLFHSCFALPKVTVSGDVPMACAQGWCPPLGSTPWHLLEAPPGIFLASVE